MGAESRNASISQTKFQSFDYWDLQKLCLDFYEKSFLLSYILSLKVNVS